jgi:phosphatidylglycerophosphate synthase
VISSKLGHAFDPAILRTYRILFLGRTVSPNFVTILGALCAFAAALVIAFDYPRAGAVVLLAAALLDMMDGALARTMNQVTAFGGFLDSVLDRYSDLLLMGALVVYFLRRGDGLDIVLTFIAAIGVAIIPYAKARADAAHLPSNTGLLERPERILILLCGLFSGLLHYTVIVLAVLTHVTVLQRILYARRRS